MINIFTLIARLNVKYNQFSCFYISVRCTFRFITTQYLQIFRCAAPIKKPRSGEILVEYKLICEKKGAEHRNIK